MSAVVVICAHTMERWDVLQRGLDAVLAQDPAPREVVVVADAAPALLARLRAERPEVVAAENTRTGGACGARNTGAARARDGEVLCFLDDDAVPAPGWLAAHLAAYADPAVVGTGGPVLPAWQAGAPDWFPPELLWVVGCTWTAPPDRPVEIRNPIAANMTVRATLFHAVGGLDEQLGRTYRGGRMWGTAEETELAIRIARHVPGGRWTFAPGATVAHDVPPARGTLRYLVRRCEVEGRAKAVLARLDHSGAPLASERGYVARDVPRALRRDLAHGAVGRAAALVGAVFVTGAAYAGERVRLAAG